MREKFNIYKEHAIKASFVSRENNRYIYIFRRYNQKK